MYVQCAPHINYLHSIVMILSRFIGAQSLFSLAQKFTNSDDPIYEKCPLWRLHLVTLIPSDCNGTCHCVPTVQLAHQVLVMFAWSFHMKL